MKEPGAYQFRGSHWTKRSLPAKAGDTVTFASATSASHVWAFTFDGAVLRSWRELLRCLGLQLGPGHLALPQAQLDQNACR